MRIITVNGRLAADVTRQISKQGTEFINFSIANTEYGDPNPQWFRVTSFQPRHVNLAQYLKKGKPITVIGTYSNHQYQNHNTGQSNIINEIIASEICFEVGAERQENVVATTTNTTSVSTINAVDGIPQATSRKLSRPKSVKTEPIDNSLGGGDTVEDDDLPF